jgi:uncharacterized protein YutE (UPF0331/DUF86 family)
MYDRERVGSIIISIERYFSDLESIKAWTEKDLKDRRNFYSVSMIIFSILNRALDLGEEVITAEKLGTPSTYKDIFFLLMKGGVINKDMKESLSELSSYRNLFSHEYYSFTEKDVLAALKKISVVKEFVKRVKARVSR